MKDFKARVEKLLIEAAECDMVAKLATDAQKREMFEKFARDYREMALGIQGIVSTRGSDEARTE